jgi:hypothetical protein
MQHTDATLTATQFISKNVVSPRVGVLQNSGNGTCRFRYFCDETDEIINEH